MELKLSDSVARDECISLANVNLGEIVEFSPDEESKILIRYDRSGRILDTNYCMPA